MRYNGLIEVRRETTARVKNPSVHSVRVMSRDLVIIYLYISTKDNMVNNFQPGFKHFLIITGYLCLTPDIHRWLVVVHMAVVRHKAAREINC